MLAPSASLLDFLELLPSPLKLVARVRLHVGTACCMKSSTSKRRLRRSNCMFVPSRVFGSPGTRGEDAILRYFANEPLIPSPAPRQHLFNIVSGVRGVEKPPNVTILTVGRVPVLDSGGVAAVLLQFVRQEGEPPPGTRLVLLTARRRALPVSARTSTRAFAHSHGFREGAHRV